MNLVRLAPHLLLKDTAKLQLLCVCVLQTLEDVFLKLSEQQDLQLSKKPAKGASIVSNETTMRSVCKIIMHDFL